MKPQSPPKYSTAASSPACAGVHPVIIAAMSTGGVIGRDGNLPWRLPADLRRFKQLTTGHAVIMGRKTFETLPEPLPGRTNIVITRDRAYRAGEGVIIAHSLDEALIRAGEIDDRPFILGGGEIYRLALQRVDRMELTIVDADVEGDTRFPEFDRAQWKVIAEQHHPADDRNEFAYTFQTLERIDNAPTPH